MARSPPPPRWPAAALALAALAASGCLTLRGTAERPAVRSLRVVGARAVPEDEIVQRIATQPSDRLVGGDVRSFDPDVFGIDQRRILAFYRARGYYQARIAAAEVRPGGSALAGDAFVDLTVRVEEGPPVRVAEVRIEGAEPAEPGAQAEPEPPRDGGSRSPAVSEALARLGALPIRAGMIFTEEGLDAGRGAIERALQSNGYPRPEVEQLAEVDPAAQTARVLYTVKPGGRYRVGGLFVSGTSQVLRERVREVALESLTPGAWYDATLLPEAQARVHGLGVFGGVRVSPGRPDDARGTIPVLFQLREAPFRTIRLGPSLGFDAARMDGSLTAGWTHRNWLGGLRKLSLDSRLGWTWVQPQLRFDRENYSGLASADFTQPRLLGRHVDFNTRMEAERRIEPGLRYWVERLRLGLPIRFFGQRLGLFPSLNFDYYQSRGETAQVEVGQATQNLLSCPESEPAAPGSSPPLQRCLLAYLEQRVDLDLRDDALEPRRGIYFTISLQEGLHLFNAGFRYLRLLPELRAYLPLPGRAVLAARGRFGVVRPYGGDAIPIVARFTSGGSGQMRGYAAGQLSPVVRLSSGTLAPVGGTGLADGSVELRLRFGAELGAVLFVDAGNTYLDAGDLWRLDQLQWAPGLGVRWHTPYGTLRADVAARLPVRLGGRWVEPTVPVVQLPEVLRGPVASTHPGHTAPFVGVHLSLGEAF